MMEILVAALVLVLACLFSALVMLVLMPFEGAIVRLRANYLPKAITLDNVLEDGRDEETPRQFMMQSLFWRQRRSTGKIGPVVNGIIPMMMRTRRLEGWLGLWKGITPQLAQMCLIMVAAMIILGSDGGLSPYRNAPPGGPGNFPLFSNFLYLLLSAFIMLPFQVIVARCVSGGVIH